MQNKILSVFFSIVIIIGMSNCGAPRKAIDSTATSVGKKPKWVKNRPVNSEYYIGIAVASKTANPSTYSIVAQRNALNELAASIEVKVKSNSMLFSFEEQNQYKDEFKEFIQIKTNQEIENYDLVASWENDFEYWVYYKLSKEQYRKDKQERISKATNMAVELMKQGGKEWVNGNYRQGIILYFDALKPIKPYLGEPLPVTLNGSKDVFLGNYILTQISQMVRVFMIKPVHSDVQVTWGGKVSDKNLTFLITDYDGNVIPQIPVKFNYSEGQIRPRIGVSGEKGTVFTEIKKLTSTNNLQNITSEIDFQMMIIGAKRADEIDKLIFAGIIVPKTSVQLHVSAPSVFVYSVEKELGKGNGNQLKLAFQNQASKLGFRISKSRKDADLLVYIETDTRKAGIVYGLKNSFLSGNITITNTKSSAVIYQRKFDDIKGVNSSFSIASKDAYKKAEEKVVKKIVPRFYRKYTN